MNDSSNEDSDKTDDVVKNMVDLEYLRKHCYGLDEDSNLIQPDVVSRKQWGARASEGILKLLNRPVSNVIVTYAPLKPAADKAQQSSHVWFLQRFFIWQGFFDIPYSFLVFPNGDIYEGRGWIWESDFPFGHRHLHNNSILIARLTKKPDKIPEIIRTTTDESIKKIIDYGLLNEYVKKDYERHDMEPWHILA